MDWSGLGFNPSDRKLILMNRVLDGIVLKETDAQRVLQHSADLWGYVDDLNRPHRGRTASQPAAARRSPASSPAAGLILT